VLNMSESISVTPDQVLQYTQPTKGFLCPLTANTYGIDFLSFKIKSADSNAVVFEVSKDPNAPAPQYPENFDYNQLRSINYTFPIEFLRFRTVATTLRFRVGDNEVNNFRMIERHYSNNKLMKSYDFNFNFCIPNSSNEWEAVYEMPQLTEAQVQEIVKHGSQSDSFYFVGTKLIMHNKAHYSYTEAGATENKQNH